MESKRIFIAANLPPEVKEEIYEKFSGKIPNTGCKVVVRENLHITMLFLGYWHGEKIPEVREKLNSLDFEKFRVGIGGIGHFKGKVVWLGVLEGAEKLGELSGKLNGLFGIEDGRFHAHITLARNRSMSREEMDALLEVLGEVDFSAEIEVKGIDLMESVLTPKGAQYTKLFSVDFT